MHNFFPVVVFESLLGIAWIKRNYLRGKKVKTSKVKASRHANKVIEIIMKEVE